MSSQKGALVDRNIREMIDAGCIKGCSQENINPASLDLAISEEVYRIDGLFQPQPGENVHSLLPFVNASRHELSNPLERGVTYLACLRESFSLPRSVYGYCNPKSSTGRNDVHVRVIANDVARYDAVPNGYQGEIWIAINPKSFPILLSEGEQLSQVRFFDADTRFGELDLELTLAKDPLMWTPEREPITYQDLCVTDKDGTIILGIDLNEREIDGVKAVGWEARGSHQVFDFSELGSRSGEFFEPLKKRNGLVHLRQGGFYILSTDGFVRVSDYLACEMVPMDARSGEYRSHYAGFIDTGWGLGEHNDQKGRPLTLEVRPFEDMILRPGQPIAKIQFERTREVPELHYDQLKKSHYTGQLHALLSKHHQ